MQIKYSGQWISLDYLTPARLAELKIQIIDTMNHIAGTAELGPERTRLMAEHKKMAKKVHCVLHDDLPRCPYCGSHLVHVADGPITHYVECRNSSCDLSFTSEVLSDVNLLRWNIHYL